MNSLKERLTPPYKDDKLFKRNRRRVIEPPIRWHLSIWIPAYIALVFFLGSLALVFFGPGS